MTSQLLNAITPTKKWSENFTRYQYREAFVAYRKAFELLYVNEVQNTQDLSILASSFLDELEAHWAHLHFWNRSSAKVDEKLVIVSYLTPMLLASSEPRCGEFAQILSSQWNLRFSNNTYELATYQQIRDGFRHVVLGIDFENKHIDK